MVAMVTAITLDIMDVRNSGRTLGLRCRNQGARGAMAPTDFKTSAHGN